MAIGFTPDTILRWYHELIARKYDGSARRRIGRPAVAADVEQLVVRMATEERQRSRGRP